MDEKVLLLHSLWGDAINGSNLLCEATVSKKNGDEEVVKFKLREAGLRLEECLVKVKEYLR